MQIKVFKRPLSEVPQLEEEINAWLAGNKGFVTVQRDSHVARSQGGGEDHLVVMIWYGRRNEV